MIPSTHITIDGDEAWWVVERTNPLTDYPQSLNRPCDRCEGWGLTDFGEDKCPDCDGTGRHTFTIEVQGEQSYDDQGRRVSVAPTTLRVHVVEVLPILGEGDGHDGDIPHICHSDGYLFPMPNGDDTVAGFPMPAAEPGMWAIKLAVHA